MFALRFVRRFVLCYALLIFSCLYLSSAHISPSHIKNITHPSLSLAPLHTQQESTSEACGFPGNSDLYGLGIRIGYYTQTLAAWAANFFVLGESKSLRSVNILFMLAMFIGLIWISHTTSGTHSIEAFLLLQLLLTIWWVSAKEKSKWSGKHIPFDPTRMILREMSAVGILIYNFWFWWFGLDFFESSSCGTYVFFWTKVNLYAGFRSAQKVLSITTLCFHTFLTIGHVAQLQNHWRTRHIRSSEYFSQLTKSLLQESTAKALEQECQDSSSRQEAVTTKAEYIDSACSPILEYTPEDIPTSPLNQSQTSTTCVEESLPSVVEADNADTTSQQQLASKPLILDLTYSTPITPSSPLLLFERLHTAEIYLDAILSSSHMPPILKISIPHTPVRIAIPSPYSLFPACSIPRSIQSLRLHILISTLIHIYNLRQHPTTRFPYFLCLSFSSPRYTTLDPESLDAYLLLRTTSLPSQNRKSYTIPTAAFTLLVTVGIILSIELGLRWNAVQGVQSIGAVGQLVPMILGVGGLVKVAWAWWVERRRGEGEDNGEEEEPWIVEAEKCAEVYYSLRNGVVGGQETV